MLNRSVCDVLEEMRKSFETRNFSYLLGLIEEIQSMVNKMEARLNDIRDFEHMEQRYTDLKKECRELQKIVVEKGD